MKRIRGVERILSEQIEYIARDSQSLHLVMDITHGFMKSVDGLKKYPVRDIPKEDLEVCVAALEKRNWISIQQDSNKEGIFILFINFFPTIYGYNYKKA